MSERVRVRVSTDGKQPCWELLVDNLKVCDLTYIETLELGLQIMSSLRWITEALPRK
ncbi:MULTISPECIES: hypothetical protein [unclassified Mesorhizobium]|uniref:hypothetical protein n=1 Tax=unclassified Mesorhizobium TaxID=325217 RepID=UPI0016767ACB|nr:MULTISPECIES: hypothetical protein [unclassified Mesorhizobium]